MSKGILEQFPLRLRTGVVDTLSFLVHAADLPSHSGIQRLLVNIISRGEFCNHNYLPAAYLVPVCPVDMAVRGYDLTTTQQGDQQPADHSRADRSNCVLDHHGRYPSPVQQLLD